MTESSVTAFHWGIAGAAALALAAGAISAAGIRNPRRAPVPERLAPGEA